MNEHVIIHNGSYNLYIKYVLCDRFGFELNRLKLLFFYLHVSFLVENLSKKNPGQFGRGGGGVGNVPVMALKNGARDDVGTVVDRPPLFQDLYTPLYHHMCFNRLE